MTQKDIAQDTVGRLAEPKSTLKGTVKLLTEKIDAMATGDQKMGKKATDDKMLTEVKKEEDENSDGEMIPKNEDDAPKAQDNKGRKMKTGTGKKSGSKAYDDTPLPDEDDDSVDEDKHAEDQGPADRARSSKGDEEAWEKSEAEQKA